MIDSTNEPTQMKSSELPPEFGTLEDYTRQALRIALRCGEFLMRRELNPVSWRSLPLYIVPASWVPSEENLSVGGLCCAHFDVLFRPIIEKNSIWRGRGPCVTVNDKAIYELVAPRGNPVLHRASFKRKFVSVALHEIAHAIFNAPFRVVDDVSPETIEILESRQAAPFVSIPLRDNPTPWLQHDPLTFGRVLIHLAHRINESGLLDLEFDVDPSALYSKTLYGVSPLYDYAVAFGDEPERLKKIPLSLLGVFDPPDAATKLFADDVARWEARRSAITETPAQQ